MDANDRLPAGRKPVGTAEATIVAKRRTVVDELRRMAGGMRPPYTSSSAFAFAFDETSERHPADVSAVACHVHVGLEPIVEQPFTVGAGPEPGTTQPPPTPADEELSTGSVPDGDPDAGPDADPDGDPDESPQDPPSAEQLLSQPTVVTARELAERAVRALEKHWYQDAEQLFIAATELHPTDPFCWFGAGIAARGRDSLRAAEHFIRAARYLTDDDPSGAAYSAIVAAELLESIDHDDTARRTLQRIAAALPRSCPAISLHLARLETDRAERVREAIEADPMLEADVVALSIDVGHVAIDARLQSTRREVRELDDAIKLLGSVGGIAPSPAPVADRRLGPDDRLPLAWAEMNLWERLEQCEREIEEARRRLEERQTAREQIEHLEAQKAREASLDLQPSATIPFLVLSLAVSAAMIVIYALGQGLSAGWPRFEAPISLVMWYGILCLLVLAFFVLSAIWRPLPDIARARQAKEELPVHEHLVARRRYDEIIVKRELRAATEQAEQAMTKILDRRTVIVPSRPDFRAGDLPLVPARR